MPDASSAADAAAGHHDPSLPPPLPPSFQPRLRVPCLKDVAQQLRPCLQVGDIQEERSAGRVGRERKKEARINVISSTIFMTTIFPLINDWRTLSPTHKTTPIWPASSYSLPPMERKGGREEEEGRWGKRTRRCFP